MYFFSKQRKTVWIWDVDKFKWCPSSLVLFNLSTMLTTTKKKITITQAKVDTFPLQCGQSLKTLPPSEYDDCWLFVDDMKLQIIEFNCDSTGRQLFDTLVNLLEGKIANISTYMAVIQVNVMINIFVLQSSMSGNSLTRQKILGKHRNHQCVSHIHIFMCCVCF